MKIIIHAPKSAAQKTELTKKVAKLHAEAVIYKMKSITCEKKRLMGLIDGAEKACGVMLK